MFSFNQYRQRKKLCAEPFTPITLNSMHAFDCVHCTLYTLHILNMPFRFCCCFFLRRNLIFEIEIFSLWLLFVELTRTSQNRARVERAKSIVIPVSNAYIVYNHIVLKLSFELQISIPNHSTQYQTNIPLSPIKHSTKQLCVITIYDCSKTIWYICRKAQMRIIDSEKTVTFTPNFLFRHGFAQTNKSEITVLNMCKSDCVKRVKYQLLYKNLWKKETAQVWRKRFFRSLTFPPLPL